MAVSRKDKPNKTLTALLDVLISQHFTAWLIAPTLFQDDNYFMARAPSDTSSANVSLGILASEAQSLYEKAKRLREEMDKLPQGDSQRALYEKTILELLDSARKLSATVSSTARKT